MITYFLSREKIILELAEKGPCVIVGRCADYILRERDDCLSVFIYGGQKEKSGRIMRLYEKNGSRSVKADEECR